MDKYKHRVRKSTGRSRCSAHRFIPFLKTGIKLAISKYQELPVERERLHNRVRDDTNSAAHSLRNLPDILSGPITDALLESSVPSTCIICTSATVISSRRQRGY